MRTDMAIKYCAKCEMCTFQGPPCDTEEEAAKQGGIVTLYMANHAPLVRICKACRSIIAICEGGGGFYQSKHIVGGLQKTAKMLAAEREERLKKITAESCKKK